MFTSPWQLLADVSGDAQLSFVPLAAFLGVLLLAWLDFRFGSRT
jgi:hypothetical protein